MSGTEYLFNLKGQKGYRPKKGSKVRAFIDGDYLVFKQDHEVLEDVTLELTMADIALPEDPDDVWIRRRDFMESHFLRETLSTVQVQPLYDDGSDIPYYSLYLNGSAVLVVPDSEKDVLLSLRDEILRWNAGME